MGRSSTYISLTISLALESSEPSENQAQFLGGLLKRSPEQVRLSLGAGKLRLTKVAVDNVDRLISLLEKNGLAVEVTTPEGDPLLGRNKTSEMKVATQSSALAGIGTTVRTDWKEGEVIEGLYEVRGSASGGFGTVFFVFHRLWKMMMAIKTPHKAAVKSTTHVLRFLREAELWVDLGVHPNIATCYYARVINGLPRLFIEYVDGGTLESWHETERLKDCRTLVDLMLQFCHGMIYAEDQGMIHRDIKPANCLITRDRILKITDFGLVKRVEDPNLADTSEEDAADNSKTTDANLTMFEHGVLGSPWYMAPERFKQKGREDIRSDIYSFGIMLYEIAAGARPFSFPQGFSIAALVKSHLRVPPENPLAARPDLPKSLVRVMMTCLEKKPENRYPSFVDLAHALEDCWRQIWPQRKPRRLPNLVTLKADSLNNQAVSLLDLGRQAEARKLLEDAHSTNPEHLEAVYNLHTLKWSGSEASDEEVVRRLEILNIEVRQTPEYHHLMGLVALHRGDSDQGTRLLRQACHDSSFHRERWQAYEGDPKRFVDSLKLGPVAELNHFAGHIKRVRALGFEPGSQRCFSVGEDRSIRIWETSSGRCLKHLRTFSFAPLTGQLSADGSLGATAYGDAFKTLDVWNLDEGRLLRRYTGMAACGVCFSPDSKHVAALGVDGKIRVYETSSEKMVWEHRPQQDRCCAIAFAATGHVLILGGEGGSVSSFELSSSEPLFSVAAHRGAVSCVASSPAGSDILSGGVDEVVRVLDAASGRERHRFTGHRGKIVSCQFTGDGKFVLSASVDGAVKIWDGETGRCCRTITQHGEELTGLALSSDDSKMLIGNAKGSVRLWNLNTGWFTQDFLEPAICRPRTFQELVGLHSSFARAVDDFNKAWRKGEHDEALGAFERVRDVPGFSWSREAILCRNILSEASRRGALESSAFIRSFYGHNDGITDLAPGLDSLTLFSGSLDGTAAVWDVVTGRCVTRFQVGSPIRRVVVLPRLKGLLTLSDDGELAIWDASGCKTAAFPDVRPPIAVSDDGSEITAMSPDNKVLSIHPDSGHRMTKGLAIPVDNFICFADPSRTVYSLHDDTKIHRWSLAAARVEGAFRDLGLKITSLLPSPSDDKLVAGMETGQVIVYLASSGFNVADLRGHRGAVLALASTSEADLWASGSDDFSIRLWDLNALSCIITLEGHSAPVTSVTIFPNVSLMASGASDGSLRLWGLEWQFVRP